MHARTDLLWRAISDFDIDGDEPRRLSFVARLARENGWSLGLAERVVLEYKRFVYLGMRAGHPVTPSDEVDQAWHLHLTYTWSYWERMCKEVLHRPLHHGPTRGGAAEDAKFRDWYSATLASYRAAFGEEPPKDLWPPHAVRFAPPRFERVDRRHYWLVRRPRLARHAAVCVLPGAALWPASAALESSGWNPLWLVVVAAVVTLVVLVLVGRARKEKSADAREREKTDKGQIWCGAATAGGGGGGAKKAAAAEAVQDAGAGSPGDAGGGAGGGCGGGGCGGGGCGGG